MKLTDAISQVRTDTKVEVKKAQQAEQAQAPAGETTGDKVEISNGTKDMQKMREILANTPSVRTEMVATLKRQIENGEYNVPSHEIADKMLSSWLVDEGIFEN
ncbi:MAG: flagellar biosynthesis anti-sigma factor FlgM [Thermodesulfobacteriota bacterium]